MKMTLKTLTFLSGLIALNLGAPLTVKAEIQSKTSTLVISNDVYIPQESVAVTSETDVMPITDTAPTHQVNHVVLKAGTAPNAAPQSLTPMPDEQAASETHTLQTNSLVIDTNKVDTDVALSWRARGGETLQTVLTRWGNRAGHTLLWKTQDTSQLHRNFSFFGTYEQAAAKLLDREAKPENYIADYTLNAGNRITGLKKNN